jgi:hypothetical protein
LRVVGHHHAGENGLPVLVVEEVAAVGPVG